MNSNKWENKSRKFSLLLKDLKEGKIKVPLFQRNFVWNYDEIINLLNSINDGHPIGTFIFWLTSENIQIRNKIIEELSENKQYSGDVDYIIDGQQRFTTLVTLFNLESSLKKFKEIEKDINKFTKIIYNYETKKFEKLNKKENFKKENHFYLQEIFNNEHFEGSNLGKWLDNIFKKKGISLDSNSEIKYELQDVVERFYKLDIAILSLNSDYDLEEVISLFEKINTRGKKLSVFEIVNAKWSIHEINLENMFSNLEDKFGFEKEILLDSLFFIIDDKPILTSKDKINFNFKNEEIQDKKNIISMFEKTIEITCRYLEKLSFNSRTIPSKNIFKWISYLLFLNDNKDFSSNINKFVKKYIALLCINNSYGSSTNNQLEIDIKFCKSIIENDEKEIENLFKKFMYEDFEDDCFTKISSETNMMAKLLISSLLDNNDFFTGQKINKDNFDIHHIFPKKGYKNKKYEDVMDVINSYANVTPINPKTNKGILNKKFSQYVEELKNDNTDIKGDLVNHFINYDKFIKDNDPENINDSLKERNKILVEHIKEKFNIN